MRDNMRDNNREAASLAPKCRTKAAIESMARVSLQAPSQTATCDVRAAETAAHWAIVVEVEGAVANNGHELVWRRVCGNQVPALHHSMSDTASILALTLTPALNPALNPALALTLPSLQP